MIFVCSSFVSRIEICILFFSLLLFIRFSLIFKLTFVIIFLWIAKMHYDLFLKQPLPWHLTKQFHPIVNLFLICWDRFLWINHRNIMTCISFSQNILLNCFRGSFCISPRVDIKILTKSNFDHCDIDIVSYPILS